MAAASRAPPMSRIVFLLGSFYPNFSAVGYCGYQVQKCLAESHDITVISLRDDTALPLEDQHEGLRILRVETPAIKQRNSLRATGGRRAQLGLTALRAKGALKRLLSPATIDWALVRAYLDQLEALTPAPQAIVPLVFPFESVLAALAYKRAHPGTRVLPYLFDDFADSGSLHVLKLARWLKRGRHLRLERQMLQKADAILAMHPLRAHFEAPFEQPLRDKITFLEHPLLFAPKAQNLPPKDATIRLCYTGSLIGKVREPDYLLELLQAIRPADPMRADFYVMGNNAHKVQPLSGPRRVEIANHGRVAKPMADAAVQGADVLLNLGEAQGRQVSSKIFEYMATGKPILHLAYVAQDVVSGILAKYPLALCLLQERDRFAENVRQAEAFLARCRGRQLSFDEVAALYPEALPQATAELMERLTEHDVHPPIQAEEEKRLMTSSNALTP
ncbi:hypothetical protein ACFOD6_17980 [Tabrizicola soli]|uniref:Glycosyltransferase subfamily 4-like N-terminal domain-containing protein n=4 Tax=Tabrizicola soli TaxID=2185115 RepID=A0ABV7DZM1_9RHOB